MRHFDPPKNTQIENIIADLAVRLGNIAMNPSELINSLERAIIESDKPQSPEDQLKSRRLVRRLQVSIGEYCDSATSSILEDLGLPHPDDIPANMRQEQEWDEERFLILEEWLKSEFQQGSSITRTQQALERRFGFRGDILQKLQRRTEDMEEPFYKVLEAPYKLDGKPEVTFVK